MLPNKEREDVLGEKPVAYTNAGEPIFRSEKSIHRVYDEIKESEQAQLPPPALKKLPSGRRIGKGRHSPIDDSYAMRDIGRDIGRGRFKR